MKSASGRATRRSSGGWATAKCGSATASEVERFYVEGGFVEVVDNVVSLLTNRAIPADKIDEQAADQQMETARKQAAHTPELMAAREQAVAQGRAQLRIVRRAIG